MVQRTSTTGYSTIAVGVQYYASTCTDDEYVRIYEQLTGMSTVAERINMQRFLAHFRSIHRGSFFTEMRSTSGRKLLPEAWGASLRSSCPLHSCSYSYSYACLA